MNENQKIVHIRLSYDPEVITAKDLIALVDMAIMGDPNAVPYAHRLSEDPCEHRVCHGPGHQSISRCELKLEPPHEEHYVEDVGSWGKEDETQKHHKYGMIASSNAGYY